MQFKNCTSPLPQSDSVYNLPENYAGNDNLHALLLNYIEQCLIKHQSSPNQVLIKKIATYNQQELRQLTFNSELLLQLEHKIVQLEQIAFNAFIEAPINNDNIIRIHDTNQLVYILLKHKEIFQKYNICKKINIIYFLDRLIAFIRAQITHLVESISATSIGIGTALKEAHRKREYQQVIHTTLGTHTHSEHEFGQVNHILRSINALDNLIIRLELLKNYLEHDTEVPAAKNNAIGMYEQSALILRYQQAIQNIDHLLHNNSKSSAQIIIANFIAQKFQPLPNPAHLWPDLAAESPDRRHFIERLISVHHLRVTQAKIAQELAKIDLSKALTCESFLKDGLTLQECNLHKLLSPYIDSKFLNSTKAASTWEEYIHYVVSTFTQILPINELKELYNQKHDGIPVLRMLKKAVAQEIIKRSEFANIILHPLSASHRYEFHIARQLRSQLNLE